MQDINEGKAGDALKAFRGALLDVAKDKLGKPHKRGVIEAAIVEGLRKLKELKNKKQGCIFEYDKTTLDVLPMSQLLASIRRKGILEGMSKINVLTASEVFSGSNSQEKERKNIEDQLKAAYSKQTDIMKQIASDANATFDCDSTLKETKVTGDALLRARMTRMTLQDFEKNLIQANAAKLGNVDIPCQLYFIFIICPKNYELQESFSKAHYKELSAAQQQFVDYYLKQNRVYTPTSFGKSTRASLYHLQPTVLLADENEIARFDDAVKQYFPVTIKLHDLEAFDKNDKNAKKDDEITLDDLANDTQSTANSKEGTETPNATSNTAQSTAPQPAAVSASNAQAEPTSSAGKTESLTEAQKVKIEDVVYPAVQQVVNLSMAGKALIFILPDSNKVTPSELQHLCKKAASEFGISSIRFYTFDTMFDSSAEQNAESNKIKRALSQSFAPDSVQRLVSDWQKLGLNSEKLGLRVNECRANPAALYFCALDANYTTLIKLLRKRGIQNTPDGQQIDQAFAQTSVTKVTEDDLKPSFIYAITHASVPGICILFTRELRDILFDLSAYGQLVTIPQNIEESVMQNSNNKLLESINSKDYWQALNLISNTELNEGYMNRLALEKAREYLARKCMQPLSSIRIWPTGRFELEGLDETSARSIYTRLQMDSRVSNLMKSAGKYDFSHFTPLGQPKQKINITGWYTPEEKEDD